MRIPFLTCLCFGVAFYCSPTHAEDDKDKRKAAPAAEVHVLSEEVNQITVGVGTTFVASMEGYISTEYNQPNDTFSLRIIHDVWVQNRKILNKGTRIHAHIQDVIPPIQGRDAILKIQAHGLETLEGELFPIEGTLYTSMEDAGVQGGGVTQPMNGRLVRYEIMGIGMINRVMPEGPRAMGQHQKMIAGQLVRLRLDAPLKLLHSLDY
jgi:hypothetical protein